MSYKFSVLVTLLTSILPAMLSAQGQNKAIDRYLDKAGDHAALFQGRIEPPLNTKQWNTHPFWDDNETHEGSISFKGIFYPQVKLRYDVYKNLISVVSPVRNLPIVPDQTCIDYFIVDGYRHIPINGYFFRILHESKDYSLLMLRRKLKVADIIVDMHTIKALDTSDQYYIIENQALSSSHLDASQLKEVSNVNSIGKLFPEYKKQLKSFSKKSKLKYKKEVAASSLASCMSQLEKLRIADGKTIAITKDQQVTRKESEIKYTPMAIVAPDDIFAEADLVNGLPSYRSFSKGSIAQYEAYEDFLADDYSVTGDLEPIREKHILEEIMVTGFQQKVNAMQVGMEKFRPAQLKNIPLALGEADVMKMVQTLPGVKSMGEASSGFNVRGGASDQNLILLNNNTVYNPMHLFGLFSAFNSDVIGETELYKSGIPSQYGGRISSVMNIMSKIADRQEWHGSASIGLLTSKATLEAPIVKDKVLLLLGCRTTYSDWMLKMIPEKSGYKNGSAGFWDLSGTLAINFSRNHRLYLYGYYSNDRFAFSPYNKYGYSNGNGSFELKSRYNDRVSSSITAGYDHYDYFNNDIESPYEAARLSFAINQYFAKGNVTIKLTDNHELQTGIQGLLYNVEPGTYEPIGEESFIGYKKLNQEKALETALFAEDKWTITPKFKVTAGVRYTMFNAMQKGKEHTYQAPEFRVSASYNFTENQSVKLGFNTMHQYIHKVSNTSIMSPTDTWTLSSSKIKPQDGFQIAGGYYFQTENRKYEVTLEAYYKQMSNYLTYRSAGQLVMNPNLEDDVIATRGRAYGIELQLRKPIGKLNGWISYSYSRTKLKQQDLNGDKGIINGGDWFAAEYDRPHELKFVGNYKFTERYSLSLNADYSTGRPTTIPVGQYYDEGQDRLIPFYSDRNSHRLPDYFRMDASFNIEPSHHLTNLTHSWFSIGVYNVLGRRNAYSVYYLADKTGIQGYQLSIFGAPIPFVSYNIKF